MLAYKGSVFYNRIFLNGFVRSVSTLASGKPPFVMIASIGNPEPEYMNTRHNVGNMFLDLVVENHWQHFLKFREHRNIPHGVYSTSPDLPQVFLFKSIFSYMNLQGSPISKSWKKVYDLKKQESSPALVVIHDEIQLPLGKFQIRRQNTSARGHNGLRSINESMGMGYTKICIGVGKPNHKDVARHVLSRFKPEEKETLYFDVFPQIFKLLDEIKDGKHIYEVFEGDSNKKSK